jgi:hypothetical protein
MLATVACTNDVNRSTNRSAAPPTTDAQGNAVYADAHVTGALTHTDRSPANGVPVVVIAGKTTGEHVGGFLALMFTGGIACVANDDVCFPKDATVASVTTAADGTYTATLPGAYLQGYETNTDWTAVAHLAATGDQAAGPVSSFEFQVNTPVQAAPPLALWEAAPVITAGPLVTVAVAAAPAIADAEKLDTSTRFVDERGTTVWQLDGSTVDGRLLEDVPLRVLGVRTADVRVQHSEGRTIYHQSIASAVTPYTGALVPISRGKVCATEPAAAVGCPLTDGNLVEAAPPVTTATIDLGDPGDVGLVVARGCAACTVSTSIDGTTYQDLPPAASVPAITIAGGGRPVSARFVRVASQAPVALSEISVWQPTDAQRAVGQSGLVRPGQGGTDVSDKGRSIAALVALLLIAGVLVGAVAVLIRRRTASG